MGILTIKNLVFYGYHGVQDFEKELGGRFEVDIKIRYPFSRCSSEDTLHEAVDYQQVYGVVKDMVTGRKYHLIETLANHIAEALVDQFSVDEITVVVRKKKVPIDAVLDFVEVEVTRLGHPE
ncbi:MAG: dihydroneopterin aldolase [Candidatus Marinimicrobia bacterium]|jgi:dihydroneopterin aldolase|nr:dihydroneopterin aldolase [Candidatus Neomarinimicrobiota bacterium]MBT3631395.1 dihydroneopterin aldolase [Candidatus Neomarinimicrobiota bacterium]MBT3825394.1 dihydroneopterin aldolase [Candidatus Neomarinimicrobiota bacterium]MBT4131495.1 dihydroneopterin aldolase [Candidatus Neomarinimicrobiota bacterium]MBT4294822.1 dihydroneopterin aldolase [Candidatus Neomarinimicrobiota bacterium]